MSAILKAAWERVILSYKSTLIGLGAGIGLILIDSLTSWLGTQPQAWAKVLAALVVVVGASLKSKALPPATP
jgi:hypothetical protein